MWGLIISKQIMIRDERCILYTLTGRARQDSQRRWPLEDAQVFLSQEVESKRNSQSRAVGSERGQKPVAVGPGL